MRNSGTFAAFAFLLAQATPACRVGYEVPFVLDGGNSPDGGPPACSPWTGQFTVTEPERLDVLNSPSMETEAALTADALTLYFSSTRITSPTGSSQDVWVAHRPDRNSPFGDPEYVDEVNTDYSELRLVFTEDGLDAFLNATWPGGMGNSDIYCAHRDSPLDSFGEFRLCEGINSDLWDYDPEITPDGLRLYFYRRGDLAVNGHPTLLIAERSSRADAFGAPEPIPAINSEFVDDNPTVSRDELLIVFSSVRPSQNGELYDLWYSVRASTSADFSEPLPVPVVNTSHQEHEPYISLDGCELFFSSDRPEGQGLSDLYRSRIIPGP